MQNNSTPIHKLFILITALVFSALVLPAFFTRGMFMDGMIYGSIARNLSEGKGTLWDPQFSGTLLQTFHEHPPLSFGLESLVFRLTGDVIFTERLYALLIAGMTIFFITGIFRQLSPYNQLAWMPALLWISTERVFWGISNNMLENTLSLFTCGSVYHLTTSLKTRGPKFFHILIAAVMIFLAFLSKGLPSLFPLAFFACYFISVKNYKIKSAVTDSLLLLCALALVSLLFYFFFPKGVVAIKDYLMTQVRNSVQGNDRVGERLPFISGFFQQILHMIIILSIILFYTRIKKVKLDTLDKTLFAGLIGLCAFVPLLISPKLSFYYLIPSIPFFAIAFALIVSKPLAKLFSFDVSEMNYRIIATIISGGIIVIIAYSISNYGEAARDRAMIETAALLKKNLPPDAVISFSQTLEQDWAMIAVLQRYARINVKTNESGNYLLLNAEEKIPEGYSLSGLPLSDYRLVIRANR